MLEHLERESLPTNWYMPLNFFQSFKIIMDLLNIIETKKGIPICTTGSKQFKIDDVLYCCRFTPQRVKQV